jgi:hypothetical protein
LDQEELDEGLIGMKRVTGGAMQDSLLIDGVAFKKTFSYAGFEQQPKSFKNPKVLSLNVELELKAERDNAEVRVEAVDVSIVVLANTNCFHTTSIHGRQTSSRTPPFFSNVRSSFIVILCAHCNPLELLSGLMACSK